MVKSIYQTIFILVIALLFHFKLSAQNKFDEYAQAKVYLTNGDYLNATTLIKKLITFDSSNLELRKDLALCYNFQKEYNSTIQLLNPLIENNKADDQCFQIMGNAYKALHQIDDGKLLFLKALSRFPNNGALYNEMADLMWSNRDNNCIKYWEKGIEKDPEFSKNYYNACRYYNSTNEKMWSLIYGEIFVNMEPNNSRTPEIKKILVDNYRKLLTEIISDSILTTKNNFTQKYLGTVYKEYSAVKNGINSISLSLLRTRFILDWFKEDNTEFPHQLFTFHQSLLRKGLFESYNQWLLGSSENLDDFQNWTQLHQLEYNSFINYYKTLNFKMPSKQYYN